MTNVLQMVHSIFSTAIKTAYPAVSPSKGVVQGLGSKSKFGDYQCMAAMSIAQVRSCVLFPSIVIGYFAVCDYWWYIVIQCMHTSSYIHLVLWSLCVYIVIVSNRLGQISLPNYSLSSPPEHNIYVT